MLAGAWVAVASMDCSHTARLNVLDESCPSTALALSSASAEIDREAPVIFLSSQMIQCLNARPGRDTVRVSKGMFVNVRAL